MDSKQLEKKVKQTLKKIRLSKKSKILVALSGGKDSSAVAFLLKKFGFEFEGVYVDLCVGEYSKNCMKKVEVLCGLLDVKLNVYDLKKEQGESVKDYWKKNPSLNSCATCGVLKKWVLNKFARENNFEVVVTGHNLDDEAQTFLINIFKGSPELSAKTGAITKDKLKTKKFISRVKPLYYVAEKDVLDYARKNKLPFLEGKCPYAKESYRIEVRNFLEKKPANLKEKIIRSFENVKPRIDISGKVNSCEVCGEPCKGKKCKKCSLENSPKSLNKGSV